MTWERRTVLFPAPTSPISLIRRVRPGYNKERERGEKNTESKLDGFLSFKDLLGFQLEDVARCAL